MKLRTGRRMPKNLYVQLGAEPGDHDPDVGRVDSAALAQLIVTCVNAAPAEDLEVVADELQRARR